MSDASDSPLTDPNPRRRSPLMHFGHPDAHIPLYEAPEVPSKPIGRRRIVMLGAAGVVGAFLAMLLERLGEHAVTPDVPLPWVIPFVLLLACIAVMPFVAKHFWEHYYPHVAMGLGLIVAVYYLFVLRVPAPWKGPNAVQAFFESHAGRSMARSFGEYISFIFLLGSLFAISGGILIRVRRKATPAVNTALLLTGAVIANLFGTTGAAMLLIRPYLRINQGHLRPFHVVFFIFIVANVGGSLTPIGDPPLFLGYLKGVPFWWVLDHCWPMWLVAVGALTAVFFVLDTVAHGKQARETHDEDLGPAVSIYGMSNMLLVFAVLAGVLLHDTLVHYWAIPWRELIMTAAVVVSLWTTPRRIHLENVFNFAPIREVALLFVGIFATMVPALNYLSTHAHDGAVAEYLQTPGQFYYSSGALSSVLDNAPTYLTFLETELGKLDGNVVKVATEVVKDPSKDKPGAEDYARLDQLNADKYAKDAGARDRGHRALTGAIAALREYHGERVRTGELTAEQIRIGFLLGDRELNLYLMAVSLGSVFFGACTYIGNGPNFMVKSIADNAGAKTPSFFGYIGFYTLPILLPVLILVWAVFLR